MLSLLVAARDAENETDRLSDDEIADQIMLFLLAGHDTTSVTLACTLVHLAISAEWQAIVRNEVDAVLHGRAPTAADVNQLTWTSRVTQETMRLHPAAHGMARSTHGDQVLDGYLIPDGAWVELSPWAVHHAPTVWADPDLFGPRRFDVPPGQHPGGHRNALVPFRRRPANLHRDATCDAGIQLVTAIIVQHFMITTPLAAIPVHAAITLLPTGELPITVVERSRRQALINERP